MVLFKCLYYSQGSGQLGRGDLATQNSNLPQIVAGPLKETYGVASVAAGGNTSWVTVEPSVRRDMRAAAPALLTLDTELLEKVRSALDCQLVAD